MKKYLLLFLLLFSLAGCTFNPNSKSISLNENTVPGNINNYDDSAIVSKINQLKEGEQSQEKNMENEQTNEQKAIDPTKFEDLAAVYNGALIKTNVGDIKVKFFNENSPVTVNNFLNLAKMGFYNGTLFHRVIKDFMIQGGDPLSKGSDWSIHGTGGPGYRFKDEFNDNKLVEGSLAMANSGPDTNGSQFFIVTTAATPWLDGKHTNFGQVVEGMDVVNKIEGVKTNENDHPIENISITEIQLIAK